MSRGVSFTPWLETRTVEPMGYIPLCCPCYLLKSVDLNYIVYVAFTQRPTGGLEPADGLLL